MSDEPTFREIARARPVKSPTSQPVPVERLVGWLKGRRYIATRYEKLAVNYRAMVHIAFNLHYLKHPCSLPDRA
jgi:hypothetical protein